MQLLKLYLCQKHQHVSTIACMGLQRGIQFLPALAGNGFAADNLTHVLTVQPQVCQT
jgi:hypothetical protein